MKPRHDTDTTEAAETTETQAPRLDNRLPADYRVMTSGNRFWIQIAATIISPLVVAAVLWLSTSLSNMATKTDLDKIEKRIEGVEKRIEEQTERIDRLLLHLVPKGKK